jgi:hypothetical protein
LFATSARDLAVGDINGDGRLDLVGTWDAYGAFYLNPVSWQWVGVSTAANQVTAGDLDGDGIDDFIGDWPALGGILVDYSTTGQWALLGPSGHDIATGRLVATIVPAAKAVRALSAGSVTGPSLSTSRVLADKGPGGKTFAPRAGKNLVPQMSKSARALIPGPGQPGFKPVKKNGHSQVSAPSTRPKKANTPEKH